MNGTVRKATIVDAATLSVLNADVQQLHADALPHIFKSPSATTFPPATVIELMNDPNNLFFLAEVGGEVVGYIWAEVRRRPENGALFARNSVEIHHISIKPVHQHYGYGERLIAAVKELAVAEKIHTIALDTWFFNTDAHAFFARQGFTTYNYRLWMEVTL